MLKRGQLYVFKYKNGMQCFFRGSTFDALINAEIFGREEYKNLINISISKINSVIDIGAQTGVFTLYMISRNPNLNIKCIEAVKDNFDVLHKNIELNGLSNQVKLFHNAAWGTSGSFVTINLHSTNSGGNSVFLNNARKYFDKEKVQTISLKDIVGDEPCDLLKVDIEGAEYEVFKHVDINTLNKISNIVMEVHGSTEENESLRFILEQHGFKVDVDSVYLWAWKD